MSSFYNKSNYDISDIQRLIDDKVEEGPLLEFKSSRLLDDKNPNHKLCKSVSSFANTSGGIILLGLKESGHVASKIEFIDGKKWTREKIEHILSGGIQRRIQDLQIIPIRNNNSIEESIYLIKVAQSADAPHQVSSDKRFYKRFNFESVPMEEFEIRNLYLQSEKTKLSIGNIRINEPGVGHNGVLLTIRVPITNDGNTPELTFKTSVEVYGLTKPEEINWQRTDSSYSLTKFGVGHVKLSRHTNDVIFPEESETEVFEFDLHLNRDSVKRNPDMFLRFTVYYSSGKDELTLTIQELIETLKNHGYDTVFN